MARYAMVTDLKTCVGCHACTASCSAEWDVPPGQARTHVHTTGIRGTFPNLQSSTYVAQCNHCDHPTCVDACPSSATYRTANGIVAVDKNLCIGCGFCIEACPYDARFLNPVTRQVDKCDFCAARLARGQQPACVTTCTAGAKHFGDLEDRTSEVFRMVYGDGARRVESPTVALGPNVFYLGRPKQLDLVAAGFPPREPRRPASATAWNRFIRPLVFTAVGATFLGQALAFFTQLHKGENDFEE